MLAAALAQAPAAAAAAAAAVAMLVCNLAAFSFFLELQIAMWTPLIGTAFVVSSSAACRPCRPAVATVPQTSRGSLGFVGQFPAPPNTQVSLMGYTSYLMFYKCVGDDPALKPSLCHLCCAALLTNTLCECSAAYHADFAGCLLQG